MKNIISNITTLLITLLLVASCGSIKNMNPGDKKFEPPCTGKAYMSSKKAFREPGVGESIDYATSRKKALSNARSALAETVNSTIKKVEDNFVNSLEEREGGLPRKPRAPIQMAPSKRPFEGVFALEFYGW